TLCVAQIVGDVDQLERVDEPERRLFSALDLERHHPTAAGHLCARKRRLRMILAEGVKHPYDARLVREKIGDHSGILAMRPHAQGEGLQTFEVHPCVEWTHRRTGVAQENLQMVLQEILAAKNHPA